MSVDISKVQKKPKAQKANYNFDFLLKLSNFFSSGSFRTKDKMSIYRDLATLIAAGIDFKTALEILAGQQKKEKIKDHILNFRDQLVAGRMFHEALRASGRFSEYECFSIQIGEETKRLNIVLIELHKYFKRQARLKKQIISVLTYPAFVLVLTFAVLYFMLNYVVPMFGSVFNQFDAELPKLTKSIILLSENSGLFFSVILIIVIIVTIFYVLNKEKTVFRAYRSRIMLKIPFFGRIIRLVYLARFCQFMDLLLTSKTSLIESLSLVQKVVSFYPIEVSLTSVKNDVVKGLSFNKALSRHAIYEDRMTSMIRVAEEINTLDTMFSRLADEYDEEVEHKTKMIGVVLEPMIIIFIGLVVGIIMVAMYAPMFDLSKIISS